MKYNHTTALDILRRIEDIAAGVRLAGDKANQQSCEYALRQIAWRAEDALRMSNDPNNPDAESVYNDRQT